MAKKGATNKEPTNKLDKVQNATDLAGTFISVAGSIIALIQLLKKK